MATTPVYALRYPVGTDTPDGATAIQNLATDVEAQIVRKDTAPIVTVFTANGNFIKAATAKFVLVEGWAGGGGSGAAGTTTAGQSAVGGGGASGGYFKKLYAASALLASEPVGVGAGGAGTPTAGNTGGNTTFKACTANGGTGGASMAGGAAYNIASGGTGGTASGGDENITGSDGGKGCIVNGTSALFHNFGGAAPRGGGMTGYAGSTRGNGVVGKAPGGGAAGAYNAGAFAGLNGVAGADGKVIVTQFF